MTQIHFIKSKILRCWARVCFMGVLLLGLTACANLTAQRASGDFVPVGVVGVQHMGPDFNVAVFYIDGAGGSNVGRGGGGGGSLCCASLPRKWRPSMTTVVRWSVNDWQKDTGYAYKAVVPIEKYDDPGRIYVHFFPGGKVRVISSNLGVLHPDYPILYGPHDDATATEGVAVEELFSPEEKEERKRQRDAQRKKYGDWR